MKRKIKEWGLRYLPAEFLSLIAALLGGSLINLLFRNPVITAYGATWSESIIFYSYFFYKEVKVRKQEDKISFKRFLKVLRNIIMEFGAGEYLDAFVTRPAAMYFFPRALGNLTAGLIFGKYTADLVFYTLAIISYELKKKIIVEEAN